MAEMENLVWQPLPGAGGVRIYPCMRKVDIISSNSYIVEAPGIIVVVDPGGLPEQADILLREIDRLLVVKPRPVLICLTHVHLDHCSQLLHHPGFGKIPRRVVAVQDYGAKALETGDRAATIADLLRQEVHTLTADIRLLPPDGEEANLSEEAPPLGMPRITSLDPLQCGEGVTLRRQYLPLHGETVIEFIHTPGHSPDSICIRIGEVLFIGDLLFATAPGIAGLKGWDLCALNETISGISELLGGGEISVCLPGHGRPLDIPATLHTLQALKKEAGRLDGIETINPEWVKETAAYAGDLMDEVDRLFTIISGRLVYVAHVLDELEESGEAERLLGLIDGNLVEELLSDFNRFSLDFHSGQVLEIHLALKANQITQKLNRVFQGEMLGSVLDLSLVRRVERLLEDYTITFRGFRPRVDLRATDLSIATGEVIAAISTPPYQEEGIIEAESEEEFARALALRIAYVNPFENLDFGYSAGKDIPLALLDRERFGDILLYLMEKISVAGVNGLSLATGSRGGRVWTELTVPCSLLCMGEKMKHFLGRSCRLSGGTCILDETGGGTRIRIEYPEFTGQHQEPCEHTEITGRT